MTAETLPRIDRRKGQVYGQPTALPQSLSDAVDATTAEQITEDDRDALARIAAAALPPVDVVDSVELDTRWAISEATNQRVTFLPGGGMRTEFLTSRGFIGGTVDETPVSFPPNMCVHDDCAFDVNGPLCPHGPGSAVSVIPKPTKDKPVVVFQAPTRLDQASPAEIVARINAGVTR